MKIFLTGATGYIGQVVAEQLQQSGHQVYGLARSPASAAKLHAMGVEVVAGDLRDLPVLQAAARQADAVIHTAICWGAEVAQFDEQAVRAMLEAMARSNKPFLYTSGVWVLGDTKGHVAGEMWKPRPPAIVAWRLAVERLVLTAGERGVRGMVIRPAMVYGRGGGFVAGLVQQAKQKGCVEIAGTGENHMSFVPVEGLAKLYVLAVESPLSGELFLAADGPAFTVRSLAEATGARVETVPLELARQKFGPVADALVMDQRVMSTKAGRLLGWNPRYPSVLEEVKRMMAE
ncbi:MAG: SDR family oxidoreductase [Bryobacteraceae bacterium]|nr:SDR family oxidoreductase [Bryobacteraceae bacterium]MDW8379426.1 SDR family oxidoreductase [Bryobacterales bacterium]